MVLIQVTGGRPTFFLDGFRHSRSASLAGVIGGRRTKCPNQFSRRLFMVVVHLSILVMEYSFSLLSLFG